MTAEKNIGSCRSCRSVPVVSIRKSADGTRIVVECERCQRRVTAPTMADAAAQWNQGEPKVPPISPPIRKIQWGKSR